MIAPTTTRSDTTIPRFRRRPPAARIAISLAPAAAIILLQLVVFPLSAGLFLRGIVVGALTALIALGMAITYRANRIVNFAQGDLGTAPVVLAFLLLTVWHWPYLFAVLAGALAALVLGALVELAVIRRFFRASRLLLTVATLGLAQLLAAAGILLPSLFGEDRLLAPRIDPPFDIDFTVGQGRSGVLFHGNDVVALVTVPVVIFLLAVALRSSAVGVAVRASADSADRASLLGVPVKRLQTVVWAVTGLLAFVAVFLRAGVLGLPIDSTLSFDLLLRSLTALVLGGMTDLVAITAAATALGVLEVGIGANASSPTLVDPILAATVFVALLVFRRRRSSRVALDDVSTWRASEDVRPIPTAMARLPLVRLARWGSVAVVAGVAVLLPHVLSVDRSLKASALLIYAILGLSLVVLTGWAGQVSLGQIGFFAIGAALGAKATQDWGFDLTLALAFVAAAGAVVAVVVGLPALRRRGLELAVITLAFALAVTAYFLNHGYFSWVPNGRIDRPPLFGRVDIDSATGIYYLSLAVLAACLIGLQGVRRSRTGRALIALRDNERGAQAYALDPTRLRLVAFAMSGALAAVAGCLLAQHEQAYDPTLFGPFQNLSIFTMVIVGGVAAPGGAVLGALYLLGTRWFLPSDWQLFASGFGVLLILLVLPEGLGGLLYRLRDRFIRRVGRVGLDDEENVIGSDIADLRAAAAARSVVISERRHGHSPLLSVRGLDVSYGAVQVLFGIDLEIEEGACVALLGTNGAGKSTLLRAICGVVRADRGAVTLDGREITGTPANKIAALGVAQVPGGQGVFPSLTVEDNLRTASWLHRRDRSAAAAGMERARELFPVLAARWSENAGDLSGGQQQMLALGMAFLSTPRLLLIDELSLGLAPVVVAQLLPLIEELRADGTTVVLVEQSVNLALTVADTAYFLEKGEMQFHGATAELLERPEILRSVFLSTASAEADTGHRADAIDVGFDRSALPPALELVDLSCSFGGIRAVDSVSLEVAPSEILGIIGPNGAGKTTVFDLASGYTRPDAGKVFLGEREITHLSAAARAKAGLGRSFQDARLFPSLTVDEAIAVACERWIDVRDPISAALRLPNAFDSEHRVGRRVEELVDLLGLDRYRSKYIRELSTGTRRVVDLACLLAHRPSVVLLDEPSSGIAQREAEALVPLLLRIRDDTGASLVVIEHDIPLIGAISDRLIAMDQGSIIAAGTPVDVLTHQLVVESYLGTNDAAVTRSGSISAPTD